MNKNDIHWLARSNNIQDLGKALDAGYNIDAKDKFGSSALHYSISEGNCNITFFLLNKGADVTVQDSSGSTPLHYAVVYNAFDVAKALVEKNDKLLAIEDKYGNEPLWTAVFNARGNYEFVKLFVENGANVNHKNKVDKSPLDLAIDMGDKSLISILKNDS